MKTGILTALILAGLGLIVAVGQQTTGGKDNDRKVQKQVDVDAARPKAEKNISDEKGEVSLEVNITGLRNDKGNVLVNLFNQSDGFPGDHKKAFKIASVLAKDLDVIKFKNLPPGKYAVSVCHDENGSLKLETGLFGRPKEGVGTSNNIISKMRAPTFAESSFMLGKGARQISIEVRY